jgi:hypothetical protein
MAARTLDIRWGREGERERFEYTFAKNDGFVVGVEIWHRRIS